MIPFLQMPLFSLLLPSIFPAGLPSAKPLPMLLQSQGCGVGELLAVRAGEGKIYPPASGLGSPCLPVLCLSCLFFSFPCLTEPVHVNLQPKVSRIGTLPARGAQEGQVNSLLAGGAMRSCSLSFNGFFLRMIYFCQILSNILIIFVHDLSVGIQPDLLPSFLPDLHPSIFPNLFLSILPDLLPSILPGLLHQANPVGQCTESLPVHLQSQGCGIRELLAIQAGEGKISPSAS